MNEKEFVHLNVHTAYTLGEGLCKITPLVKKARELGTKALAITDNGNLFGAVEFYGACTCNHGEFEGLPR